MSTESKTKWILVAGARPNFIKIAPLMDALQTVPAIQPILVHTGQHYDERMSDLFFCQLGIPEPDINLGCGGGSHARQTACVMTAFEEVLLREQPFGVLVVGDVNSTIACGLVAAKLGVKLAHVEAGLRSFDRSMPEEVNRVLTDAISDLLFVTEQSGVDNLTREGVPADRIHLVGNVMIDTLLKHLKSAVNSNILQTLNLESGAYAVVTLHRPANVDNPANLAPLLEMLATVSRDVPVIFPVHPRTRAVIDALNWKPSERVRLTDPMGYLDFLKLLSQARIILTDSGGIQEEATILKVPCLTLRENTERPITVTSGANRVVGTNPERILQAFGAVLCGPRPTIETPPFWDGLAARRIVRILESVSTAS